MQIAAMILAAGASRRLGRPKQLVEYHGETLMARAIRLAQESGASPVIVVLGARSQGIREAVDLSHVHVAQNENWEQGIASSIHAGLHTLGSIAPNCAGALLLTCDQPLLTAEHLHSLIDYFTAHREHVIAASSYAEIHGVPALFPRAAFANLLELRGDKGARALFANPPLPVFTVDFPDGQIDIDTPADLERIP